MHMSNRPNARVLVCFRRNIGRSSCFISCIHYVGHRCMIWFSRTVVQVLMWKQNIGYNIFIISGYIIYTRRALILNLSNVDPQEPQTKCFAAVYICLLFIWSNVSVIFIRCICMYTYTRIAQHFNNSSFWCSFETIW